MRALQPSHDDLAGLADDEQVSAQDDLSASLDADGIGVNLLGCRPVSGRSVIEFRAIGSLLVSGSTPWRSWHVQLTTAVDYEDVHLINSMALLLCRGWRQLIR